MIEELCPFCDSKTKAKISGKGKHYGFICPEHGIIKIIRNPLLPPIPQKPKSFLEKLKYLITPQYD